MRGVVVAALVLICASATSAIHLSDDNAEKLKQDRLRIIEDQHKLIDDEQVYENDLESEKGEPHVETLEDARSESDKPLESSPPTETEREEELGDQVGEQQLTEGETDPSKREDEELRVEQPEVQQTEGGVDREALKSALKAYYDELTAATDVEGDFSPKEEAENLDAIIEKYGLTNEGVETLKADLTKKYGAGHSLNIGGASSVFRFRSRRAKTEMSSTKKLLRKYYAKINPSKLKDVDLIVSKVHGDIEHLSSLLKTKYGVALNEIDNVNEHEDFSSASSMLEENVSMEVFSKDEVKNKLLQLYAVNEPSKLPYIDALMEMYEGREGELLHAAEKKYVA